MSFHKILMSSSVAIDIDIWFLLVNDDGSPFQGASLDQVSVKPTANIVKFRDAVKDKSAKRLADFDAGELKVYLDKEDVGKSEIAVDVVVSALPFNFCGNKAGSTMHDPLFVLVPNKLAVSDIWPKSIVSHCHEHQYSFCSQTRYLFPQMVVIGVAVKIALPDNRIAIESIALAASLLDITLIKLFNLILWFGAFILIQIYNGINWTWKAFFG
jgi:hypothetical protein